MNGYSGLRILVVTSDQRLSVQLTEYLRNTLGCKVDAAVSGLDALRRVEQLPSNYDIALVDEVVSENLNGVEILQEIKAANPDTVVVILVTPDTDSGLLALRAGADRYVAKPVQVHDVGLTVRFAIRERQVRLAQKELHSIDAPSLDLDDILRLTCELAVKQFGVDFSGLVRFDRERLRGRVVARYPHQEWLGSQRLSDIVIPITGAPAEERLFYQQLPIHIPDVAQSANRADLGSVYDILVGGGIKSILIVPVVLDNVVVASFSLNSVSRHRTFSASEIELALLIAKQVARVIRTFLFQEASEARDYIRRLFDASDSLLDTLDVEKLATNIVNTLCKVTGASHTELLLVDGSEHQWRMLVGGDVYEKQVGLAPRIREKGISKQVFDNQSPRYIPDTDLTGVAMHPGMITKGVKAAACLPMISRGKSIGVLWLHFKEKHPFSETEKQALEIFARQSTAAYMNAQRVRESVTLNEAARFLLKGDTIGEVAHEILIYAIKLLGADYTILWYFDASSDKVSLYESETGITSPRIKQRFELERRKVGRVPRSVFEHKYIQVPDLTEAVAEPLHIEDRTFLLDLGIRSFLGIRLDLGSERLGMLFADFKIARGLDAEEHGNLETFASHAALALKNAKLLEQLRKARDASAAVAQISTMIQDIDSNWRSIAERTKEALDCDAVVLYRYNPDTNQIGYPPVMIGVNDQPAVMRYPSVPERSIVWDVLNSSDPIWAEDVKSHPLTEQKAPTKGFAKREGIRSVVGVPLRVGSKRVGALFVNYRNQRKFSEEDRTELIHFADQIALAIRNTQLQEVERSLYGDVKLRLALQRIADQAVRIIGTPDSMVGAFCSISLLSNDHIQFAAASSLEVLLDLPADVISRSIKTAKRGIAGRVASTGLIENVPDVTRDPDYLGINKDTRSQLSVPIKSTKDGKSVILGVISVEHPAINAFSLEDEHSLELLAAQAAVAIEYEQALGAKTSLARVGLLGSVPHHSAQGDAIAIRNTVLALRWELSLQNSDLLSSDLIGNRLLMIESLANRILEDRPQAMPHTQNAEPSIVSVSAVIRDHIQRIWQREPYKNVKCVLHLASDEYVQVHVSQDWFARVLSIIVENAVDAMQGRKVQTLTIVTGRASNSGVEVSISDTGPGIPVEIQSRLFIEPIMKPSRTKGSGVGLLMAQEIIQAFGGNIRLETSNSSGTTILIWLPSAM